MKTICQVEELVEIRCSWLHTAQWPLPQEEQEKAERNFIRETPTALILDLTSISLFSKEELKKLIPIAEKQWIDLKGKLPENYESLLT